MSERTKKSLLLVVPPALISFACTMFFAWGKHVGYDEGYADCMANQARSLPPVVIRVDDGTMAVGVGE